MADPGSIGMTKEQALELGIDDYDEDNGAAPLS
jgi:hypothetical protein